MIVVKLDNLLFQYSRETESWTDSPAELTVKSHVHYWHILNELQSHNDSFKMAYIKSISPVVIIDLHLL